MKVFYELFEKVILLLVFVCYGVVAFSQLKVTHDGKIGVELGYSQTSGFGFGLEVNFSQYKNINLKNICI
ncbi:MAG: hypothetical protein LBS55_11080 [Prevotellaceae bacterium]|jgi:hypothetical protein|nr:hypothetical protein [Prevotellaceae bacterium]